VATISLGTAFIWPAFAASTAGSSAASGKTVRQAAQAFAAAEPAFENNQLHVTQVASWKHALTLKVKAEERRAAQHRAARIHAVRVARAAARAAAQAAAQKRAQQQAAQQAQASAPSSSAPSGSPQQIASAMLGSYGWGQDQFGCLDSLWSHESGWNPSASNPSSGAYGIPQALPGSKMSSAGSDWATNAATQIRWGLGYIKSLYGSPCGAWSHEQATGYY